MDSEWIDWLIQSILYGFLWWVVRQFVAMGAMSTKIRRDIDMEWEGRIFRKEETMKLVVNRKMATSLPYNVTQEISTPPPPAPTPCA